MEEPKRLYKSRTNRVLCGVCGGIGEYFNIDPVIIRLLLVVLCCAGGSGVIGYIIAAIIIPEQY
ncbi:MAG: PspC domain-containing protein [Lachnospiraceae bacterium]|nr:PspC domain-containing protein [Lachnospiraceae bacterium]MDE6982403.1 PspC domain-containing protein [Lachnospiraceae bacterium]